MDHGKTKEPLIIESLKHTDDLTDMTLAQPASYKYAVVVRSGKEVFNFNAIVSPDMLCLIDSAVYEIKCPFYKLSDYNDAEAFRHYWVCKEATYGKTQYFLQALWYWYFQTMAQGEEINIVVGFFDLNDAFCYAKYVYHLSDAATRQLAVDFVEDLIVKVVKTTPETLPKRMSQKQKEVANTLASTCFQYRHDSELFYFSNNQLYKQRQNCSWDDTSDVPGEKRFTELLGATILSV